MKKKIVVSALLIVGLLLVVISGNRFAGKQQDDIDFYQQYKMDEAIVFFDVRRNRIALFDETSKAVLDRQIEKKKNNNSEEFFGYYFSPNISSYFSYWTNLTGRQGVYGLAGNEIEIVWEDSSAAYYPLFFRDNKLLISIENDGRESRGRLVSFDIINRSQENVLTSEEGNILNAVPYNNSIYFTCYETYSGTYNLYEYSEIQKETPVCLKKGLISPLLFESNNELIYDNQGKLRFGRIEIDSASADGTLYKYQNLLLQFTEGELSQCLVYRLPEGTLLQRIDYAAGFLVEIDHVTIVSYSEGAFILNADGGSVS